jgi:Domain of unknown function (DUF1877)
MGRGMVKPRKSITMRATVPYCTNVVTRSNRVSGFRDQTWCRVTDFEYTWENFLDVRRFYKKAAEAGRAVIFTVAA